MKTEVDVVFSSHIHSVLVTFICMESSRSSNTPTLWLTDLRRNTIRKLTFHFARVFCLSINGGNMIRSRPVVCAPCSTWLFEGCDVLNELWVTFRWDMYTPRRVPILNHTFETNWQCYKDKEIRINRTYIHQIICTRIVMINHYAVQSPMHV